MSTHGANDQKRLAALAALDLVEPGMALGLGTGSTAAHFVKGLGERVKDGLDVRGVPTSVQTETLAREVGVPLTTLDETPHLDLTVDGADELDGALALIKGGGGALLREKIVAAASTRMVVIADESKLVDPLGAFPLPVEIVPFGAGATLRTMTGLLTGLGYEAPRLMRRETPHGEPFTTDSGHWIIDCALGRIPDARALANALSGIPGIVEHGLFLDLAHLALLGTASGTVRRIGPRSPERAQA